ncbi:prolyl oligopeptidase family serine peptidase, partial [Slackia heliotrinireducens]|uniref:prolyl oligopeptidase family serine peptidase n=1 Tax=Slackia heliotrinireducens TaxID=84110 RepID=UPI003315BDE8
MKKKDIFIVLITIIILCIAIILILNINKLPKTITNNEGRYIEMTDKKQDDFQIDLVYHSPKNRNIHYHAYIPDNIEEIKNIKMYITLPGYEGLYFQGVGANLVEDFAFTAKKLNPNMIILAPQLDDWGKQSASDTIELTEYYKELYKIDRIYINGYSGGGETLSLVLEEKPELYNRALLVSSQWDGKYDNLIKSETPLYLFTGENDSYYGSENFKKTYKELYDLYSKKGLSKDYIDKILILDIKNHEYFTSHGVN